MMLRNHLQFQIVQVVMYTFSLANIVKLNLLKFNDLG